MHYDRTRKVAGSRPDEVNEFCSVDLILPAALGPQPLTEMSTRGRKIMFLWSRVRPACKTDLITAICDPIV
jgi:hypothetical protein